MDSMSLKYHICQKAAGALLKVYADISTWPAFWTSSTSWPEGGEIDLIEGVNGHGVNQATLHTTNGCMSNNNITNVQTGYVVDAVLTFSQMRVSNCSYQPGCSSLFSAQNSFGVDFNKKCVFILGANYSGGGYFVLMRDTALNGMGVRIH